MALGGELFMLIGYLAKQRSGRFLTGELSR